MKTPSLLSANFAMILLENGVSQTSINNLTNWRAMNEVVSLVSLILTQILYKL